MIPLNTIKYRELDKYLRDNNCFGFTASKRKHTIIYTYKRYFNSTNKLFLKVKVMRKTKFVMSVMLKDTICTDYGELKKLVEFL